MLVVVVTFRIILPSVVRSRGLAHAATHRVPKLASYVPPVKQTPDPQVRHNATDHRTAEKSRIPRRYMEPFFSCCEKHVAEANSSHNQYNTDHKPAIFEQMCFGVFGVTPRLSVCLVLCRRLELVVRGNVSRPG